MKIVHIITSLEVGGAEKLLVNVTGMQLEFHEVTVIYFKVPKLVEEFDKRVNVIHIPLKFKVISEIKKVLKTIKPDVVHTHLTHADLFGLLAAKSFKGIKTISTVHSTTYRNNFQDYLYYILYRVLFNFICRDTKIIAISEALKEHIHQKFWLSYDRIYLLYNTISVNKNSDLPLPTNLVKYKNKFKILFVGRFISHKSVHTLIEAIHLLEENIKKEIVVYLVGSGALLEQIKELTEQLELTSVVLFEGISNQVEKYFKASDIFVLPSISEGLPLVILEAFKFKCPIISSDITSFSELIQNNVNGLTFEVGNPNSLAEKIRILYENPDLRNQLCTSGRQIFDENFEPSKYVNRLNDIYLK